MTEIIALADGQWLAVARHPVPVGVFGRTAADARRRLSAALVERAQEQARDPF